VYIRLRTVIYGQPRGTFLPLYLVFTHTFSCILHFME